MFRPNLPISLKFPLNFQRHRTHFTYIIPKSSLYVPLSLRVSQELLSFLWPYSVIIIWIRNLQNIVSLEDCQVTRWLKTTVARPIILFRIPIHLCALLTPTKCCYQGRPDRFTMESPGGVVVDWSPAPGFLLSWLIHSCQKDNKIKE